jgi:hypothetical protein
MNEITINIQDLLELPDNSIVDYETLRQIGLLSCQKNNISRYDLYSLYRKVCNGFEYMCLYPEIMTTFDINPEKNGH